MSLTLCLLLKMFEPTSTILHANLVADIGYLLLSETIRIDAELPLGSIIAPRSGDRNWELGHGGYCARLKSLLQRVWLRQISLEPTDGLRRTSAAYGLNGHSALFVIDLSLVTYEDAI